MQGVEANDPRVSDSSDGRDSLSGPYSQDVHICSNGDLQHYCLASVHPDSESGLALKLQASEFLLRPCLNFVILKMEEIRNVVAS